MEGEKLNRESMDQFAKLEGMKEICKNCGCTFGSHHAGRSSWPPGKCPGHEGRMDWDEGPDTTFEPSGEYMEE